MHETAREGEPKRGEKEVIKLFNVRRCDFASFAEHLEESPRARTVYIRRKVQ
jgi:hypothetical protein